MPKQYPHVHHKLQPRWRDLAKAGKQGPVCRFPGCKEHAIYRVDIEVNYFRGEDVVSKACELHKLSAYELIESEAEREKQLEQKRKEKMGA